MYETIKKYGVIAHAANIIDKTLTYIALSSGYAEINPLLNITIRTVGIPYALIIAGLIGAIGIHTIIESRKVIAAQFITGVMIFMVCWNIWILTGKMTVKLIW